MIRLKHMQAFGAYRMAAYLTQGYAELSTGLHNIFNARQRSTAARIAPPDAVAIARAATLFEQAQRDNSNMELDWLWLATQLYDPAQRRYCFQQALRINPHSRIAKQAIAMLPPEASR